MEDLERAKAKPGFAKLRYTCAQALKDHFQYAWVDTCCIDKSSSGELQEAINSMYRWCGDPYAQAACCYVFLSDILGSCPRLNYQTDDDDERDFWLEAIGKSRWFTRGWTLQELLAPKVLHFFGSNWNYIGDHQSLRKTISEVTYIDSDFLLGIKDISPANVAEKMAWAAGRKTSRIEDQAYSLLGLFGVNMPMLYGEGTKAFERLQLEIMRMTTDQTILAWNGDGQNDLGRLLAESPADFLQPRKIVRWGTSESFDMTNRGLRIRVPVLKRERATGIGSLAVLNCRYEDDLSGVLALRLQKYSSWDGYHLSGENEQRTKAYNRLVFVKTNELATLRRASIEITRTFEPESSGVRLWLEVLGSAEIVGTEHHYLRGPVNSINTIKHTTSSAVASIPDRFTTAASIGAQVKCFSQNTVYIAFGFDRQQQSGNTFDGGYGQIWVWLSVPRDAGRLPNFNDCPYLFTIGPWSNGRQHGFWHHKRLNKFELDVGELKVVHAEAELREVLGEEVIVGTLYVTGPVEVE